MKLVCLFLSVVALSCFCELLDLEAEIDPFVVETRQLAIPGYPDAFNPSLIKWKDSLLMSFRTGASSEPASDLLLMSFRFRDPKTASTNDIGLVFLDNDFNVIGTPQILDLPLPFPTLGLRQQDPRLVQVGEHLYMVYSNMILGACVPEIRRIFVVELFYDGKEFRVGWPDCLLDFERAEESRWQKNWVPFDYHGELLLAYSLSPLRVLHPLLGTSYCEEVSTTYPLVDWDWGVLRGGTPAVLEGGEYLSFFHSSKEVATVQSNGKKIQHYVMGAYTFSADPPFTLTRMSPKPIVGKRFYNGPAHVTWKPLRVVFPGGLIVGEEYVWVAYGRQDHEIWVAKMEKRALLDSLVPVPALSSVFQSN